MEIVRDEAHLDRFIDEAMKVSDGKALLLDSYLTGAVVLNRRVFTPAIVRARYHHIRLVTKPSRN